MSKTEHCIDLPFITYKWTDGRLKERLHLFVRMPSGVCAIQRVTITDGNLQITVKWPKAMLDVSKLFNDKAGFTSQVYNESSEVVKSIKASVNDLLQDKSTVESVVRIPLPSPGSYDFTKKENSGHACEFAITRKHPKAGKAISSYIHFFDLELTSQEPIAKAFTDRVEMTEDYELA